MGRLIRAVLAVAVALVAPAAAGSDADLLARGRRLYEQGITAQGTALAAVGASGIRLSGARAACSVCHRRSGMGGHEGAVRVPPVAGPVLFARAQSAWPARPGRAPQAVVPLRAETRSAYDDAAVKRVLREGLDVAGVPLDGLMPRYALSDVDETALLAYLRQLGSGPIPGVDEVMHLASIVTPDADPRRAELLITTLAAWAREHRLGSMPIDVQVWRLEGLPASWPAQLDAHLTAQVPFAVLAGAGGAEWRPVRDFCERASLPCLFPIVDDAPDDGDDFYSLYFARGVALDARLLARHLRERATRPHRIVQWVDGPAGEAAAAILAAELGDVPSETRAVNLANAAASDAFKPGDVVVAWLRSPAAEAFVAQHADGPRGTPVFFSARLIAPGSLELPLAWRRDAAWVSARSDPARLNGKGALGLTPWLARLGVAPSDPALLAEIYAATYFFTDALARMKSRWSREYLLETIETSHFNRPAGAAYFSLSLAAGQREAAKAGYILRYAGPDWQTLAVVGARLVP